MMIEYALKTSHALRLSLNIAILMLIGYVLEDWTGILDTNRYGMPRLAMICAYIAYMVYSSYKRMELINQAAFAEMEAEIEDLEATVAKYDEAIGEANKIIQETQSKHVTLQQKVESYEDTILKERHEYNRVVKVAQERLEQLQAQEKEQKKLLSQLNLAQSQIKSMGEEIADWKRKEQERQERRSERARKAALAKHAQTEEAPALAD